MSQTEAIEALVTAVTDPGPDPRYHRHVMAKHRREWPALWRAIDRLMIERERERLAGTQS